MTKPLPSNWAITTVGEITLSVDMVDSSYETERDIRYIDIGSIDNVRNTISEPKRLRLSAAPSRARQIVRSGDVLFSTVRPYLRNIAQVSGALDGEIASTGFSVLRPATGVDPKYLFYRTISRDFVGSLTGEQYGVSYPAVKDDQVRAQPIEIPPSNEQHRIVAKIDELFSELDKGVESLHAAHQQLKTYRQSVLKHAFREHFTAGFRRTFPPWSNIRLGDEIEFLTSGSRGWADYYAPTGDTFIRAQNLKQDHLDLTDIAFVNLPNGNTEGSRTRVKVGDILITITGANVTKTGIVNSDIGTAYVSQHVALCRLRPAIVPAFLYWYLLSEAHGRRQLNEAAYGAGKPGLNLENIRDVTLPLPSRDEQSIVVERIEETLSAEEALRESIDRELRRTNAIRQSILRDAFSGKLVTQDPNDEPASVVLRRIRVDRNNSGTKKERTRKNGKRKAA